jgi:hypothetical protein
MKIYKKSENFYKIRENMVIWKNKFVIKMVKKNHVKGNNQNNWQIKLGSWKK